MITVNPESLCCFCSSYNISICQEVQILSAHEYRADVNFSGLQVMMFDKWQNMYSGTCVSVSPCSVFYPPAGPISPSILISVNRRQEVWPGDFTVHSAPYGFSLPSLVTSKSQV